MAETFTGQVQIQSTASKATTILLNAQEGNAVLGGNGTDGDVVLFPGTATDFTDWNKATIHLNSQEANIVAGGQGTDGDIVLFPGSVNSIADWNRATIHLNSQEGNIVAGGQGTDGDVVLFPGSVNSIADWSKATIHLNAQEGNIMLGGNGTDGDLVMFRADSAINDDWIQASIHIDANEGNMRMGGSECGVDGDIWLFPDNKSRRDDGNATIHLNANAGDIILRNADCAEEFDADLAQAEPGTVMVLDDSGGVRASATSYDKRVAGVVSGAKDYKPGIILDRRPGPGHRAPLALIGKTYCKVTAESGAIAVGDLLTTSDVSGHAMRATDPLRAFGAVIGKALAPMKEGTGLIPILVALQ